MVIEKCHIDLNHKEVKGIVDKDLEHISDEDIEYVMSLPADTLREDLHNLIMHQIGVQRRVIDYSASRVVHWSTIGNCYLNREHPATDSYGIRADYVRFVSRRK